MESDDLSDSLNDEDAADEHDPLEVCLYGNDLFEVPESLCSHEEYFKEILSLDTWQNVLTNDHRARLSEFLPNFPENDYEEKEKTLIKLFSGENFKFGNPIEHAFGLLNDGILSPDVAEIYAANQMAIYRDYKHQQNEYHHQLLNQVLISRKKLLDNAYMLPPDEPVKMQQFTAKPKKAILSERTRLRYFSVLQEVRDETGELETSSEDESYPESSPPKVTRKHKKQLQMLEASLSPEMTWVTSTVALPPGHPGSGHFLNRCLDMVEVSEERYREMLVVHKRRKMNEPNHPELNVSKVNLNSVIARANLPKRPLLKIDTHSKKKLKFQDNSDKVSKASHYVNDKHAVEVKPQVSSLKYLDANSIIANGDLPPDLQLPLLLESLFQPDAKGFKAEVKEDLHDVRISSPVPEIPQFPKCFFSLLRDLFCECPEQKLSATKLEEKVRIWQDNPAAILLHDWLHCQESWPELVSSALKFLAGDLISILPENFVPFLDYKEKQQQWQWIGSGRDLEDQMIVLCNHWLINKDNVSLDILETCQGSPPPPRVTTIWTVRATTEEEKSLYWEQERVRYQNPHKAFTFKVHGYESIVGPVKGVYGKESGVNKAREHSLLISDRPPFVTILSLVRDAAARLPNGEGTRADICELLKDSQYLALASDQQIHTVVSGALDRLHYEKDPCVKYDVNRKLWIYLHRNRTEREFERIHQAQAAAAKARRAVQKSKLPKSKSKEVPRTPPAAGVGSAEERVAALLNVDVSTTINPASLAHSPRSGVSPRTQGSPKQSHPAANIQLLRQLSASNQAHPKLVTSVIPDSMSVQRKSELSQVNLTSASLGHSIVTTNSNICSPQHSLTSGMLSHLQLEGNNSRPPSQGSVQSLPSPKTVIANVNAAQFVGVGSLQVGPSSVEPIVSSSGMTSCLGVLSVDMKPSSPSFVGQPPVLQPVLSHQTIATAPSLTCVTTAMAPSYVSAVTSNTHKTGKMLSASSASAATKPLPSFQTIVIKPDLSMRSGGNLSSLPLLSIDDLPSGDSSLMNSNPVVARLLHGSQLLSLGNLVTGNASGAVLKQGNPGMQNFKIQGTDFVQQVLPQSNLSVFPSTAASEIKIPRLTLVSQEGAVPENSLVTSNPVIGQSSLFQQGAFPLAETKVSSAHTDLSEIKRITIGSQTPRQIPPDFSQLIECGNLTNHVINSSAASSSSCSSHSLHPTHGKNNSSIVIASQENLKPMTSTYVMTTPITNASLISTPHGLRAANTLNVRALQGIKVIPMTQSLGTNKNFRGAPLLARIISPSTGLALRSGVPSELVHTAHQLKGGTTMNILHGLQSVTASPQLIKANSHVAGSSQEVPNNQPFIIQVQAPKNSEDEPNL